VIATPFPMVHLIAAHKISEAITIGYLPRFYLGILAPDAYKSSGGDAFENRKVTHLFEEDESVWLDKTLRFISEYKNDDKWFYAGYGIHILTDIRWDKTIYKPFLEEYSRRAETPASDPRRAYISDMTMIDLWLYRNFEYKNEIWALLSEAKCTAAADLITAYELENERDFTLAWYDEKANQEIEDYKYFSPEMVNGFIMEASESISRLIIQS